ncbi:MAG TPA: S24 family peptidase [Actinomycetes bacterium]|nr:S24 family peptidase [Actinomycetes bacterium]
MENVGAAAYRVYETLCRLIATGQHPSERELARAARLAVSTVNSHLTALREAGWVHRSEGKARSFKIIGGPLQGAGHDGNLAEFAVAAGPPTTTSQIDDALYASGHGLTEGQVFRIRADGNSMIDAAILNGDAVTVRAQPHANHGDTVLASVPDETGLGRRATVKRLDLSQGRPRLLPANPAYAPIESDDIAIVGKVMRVERHLSAR